MSLCLLLKYGFIQRAFAVGNKAVVVLAIVILPLVSIAQADSTAAHPADSTQPKVYKAKMLAKGFYKNKEEFFNNAPSITRAFTVQEKTISDKKKAGGIMAVAYVLEDGGVMSDDEVWGFCDGKDVYVKCVKVLGNYWKLDCIGPHPYFVFPLYQLLVSLPAQALSGPAYEIYLMNKKGKFKRADSDDVLELLQAEPTIKYSFRNALGPDMYEPNPNRSAITREYLKKFNEALIEKE